MEFDCFGKKSHGDVEAKIHNAVDFRTFSEGTREYAKVLGCDVNEKELKAVESKRQSILSKTGGKFNVFFCPCIMFNEKSIDTYRCPCKGDPNDLNRGHLLDIAENGACYCKLYLKRGFVPLSKKEPEIEV